MDNILIQGLRTMTRIGVHDWEQKILQPLLFDITLSIDSSRCDDQLEKTIDYDALCLSLVTYIESNAFKLIETVAEQVADLIHREYDVKEVSVRVSKPLAIKKAANVTMSIVRSF